MRRRAVLALALALGGCPGALPAGARFAADAAQLDQAPQVLDQAAQLDQAPPPLQWSPSSKAKLSLQSADGFCVSMGKGWHLPDVAQATAAAAQLAQLPDQVAAPYWTQSVQSQGIAQWCTMKGAKVPCDLDGLAFARCAK